MDNFYKLSKKTCDIFMAACWYIFVAGISMSIIYNWVTPRKHSLKWGIGADRTIIGAMTVGSNWSECKIFLARKTRQTEGTAVHVDASGIMAHRRTLTCRYASNDANM